MNFGNPAASYGSLRHWPISLLPNVSLCSSLSCFTLYILEYFLKTLNFLSEIMRNWLDAFPGNYLSRGEYLFVGDKSKYCEEILLCVSSISAIMLKFNIVLVLRR